MGKGITDADIAAEIAAYLDAEYPDYRAQGYVTTREMAIAWGVTMDKAAKRLQRAVDDGKMEKVIDRSRVAWWRLKKE